MTCVRKVVDRKVRMETALSPNPCAKVQYDIDGIPVKFKPNHARRASSYPRASMIQRALCHHSESILNEHSETQNPGQFRH